MEKFPSRIPGENRHESIPANIEQSMPPHDRLKEDGLEKKGKIENLRSEIKSLSNEKIDTDALLSEINAIYNLIGEKNKIRNFKSYDKMFKLSSEINNLKKKYPNSGFFANVTDNDFLTRDIKGNSVRYIDNRDDDGRVDDDTILSSNEHVYGDLYLVRGGIGNTFVIKKDDLKEYDKIFRKGLATIGNESFLRKAGLGLVARLFGATTYQAWERNENKARSLEQKEVKKELFAMTSNGKRLISNDLFEFYKKILTYELLPKLKKRYNFDTHKLPLVVQINFFKYLLGSNIAESKRLEKFCSIYGNDGINTFSSLEISGNRGGNTILSLGEKLPKEDAEKIFAGYSKLIDSTIKLQKNLSEAFAENESKFLSFPYQVADALMIRAKDILVGALKVLEKEDEKLNISDVVSAVEGVNTLVSMLVDFHTREEYSFSPLVVNENNFSRYLVTDKNGYKYGLKFFVRPVAEKNAQARVNIELSFDSDNPNEVLQKAFYNEMISFRQNKKTHGSVLRVGIDREDYDGKESLSLDIGRSEHSDDAFSRTGDVLGNLLAITGEEGHHTTAPFSTEYASVEAFKYLAIRLQDYLQHRDDQ